MIRMIFLTFIFTLSSCVGVNPNSLKEPTFKRIIQLETDSEFLITSSTKKVLWRNTLSRGTYTAVKENELGTYFLGPKNCINQKSEDGLTNVFSNGGMWLPKNAKESPKLFAIVGSNNSGEKAINENANIGYEAANTANPARYTPQGAVGGAIAGAIVTAGIKAEEGRFDFLREFDDPILFEKILSNVK